MIAQLPHLVVCTTCGRLRGPVEPERGLVQRCACEPREEDRWPGYDFNTAGELCYCCGQVLLTSGSKYSVWFCDECKQQVGILNGRLGRYAVPIGRHSFHAGWVLTGAAVEQYPGLLADFAEFWKGAMAGMDAVYDWSREVVLRILSERFPSAEGQVPIATYLAAARPTEEEKMERFRQMTTWLAARG